MKKDKKKFDIKEFESSLDSIGIGPYQILTESRYYKKELEKFTQEWGTFEEVQKKTPETMGIEDLDDMGSISFPIEYVIYLHDYDVYLKSTGVMASYDGTEMKPFKLVKAKKKTIMIYE